MNAHARSHTQSNKRKGREWIDSFPLFFCLSLVLLPLLLGCKSLVVKLHKAPIESGAGLVKSSSCNCHIRRHPATIV